jgi:CBS domain-containing protein
MIMAISSLCSNQPVSIERTASINTAIMLMKARNIGSLVVTEGNGHLKPIGIVTDRDIALNVFSDGITATTPIDRIMSEKIVSIAADAGIAEAVEKMESHGVRRIVVQDQNENLCGVVSADDILQLVGREMYGIGQLIKKQSEATPLLAHAVMP